jgi:nucleoside-diphosphate-sugar epimerase
LIFLIIGDTGKIGKYLSSELKNTGNQIISPISKPSSNYTYIAELKELLSYYLLKDERVNVINCVGRSSVAACEADPVGSYFSNVEFVDNICSILADLPNVYFLHLSSCLVYGSIHNSFITESYSPLAPENKYAMQKVEAESIILNKFWAGSFSILRLSNVYGQSISEGTLLYDVLYSFKNNIPFKPKNPNVEVDFLYECDLTDAIIKLAKQSNKKSCILNVCSESVVRTSSLSDTVKAYIRSSSHEKLKINNEVSTPHFSAQKIKGLIDWDARYKYLSGFIDIFHRENNKLNLLA